jgi:predicted lipid carrier protein YhbT
VLSRKQWVLKGVDRVLPLIRRVPFAAQRLVLEQGLNRCLAEPLRDGGFDLLRGRWMCLRVADLGVCWYLTLGGFVLPILFGALVDLTGVRSSCFMLMYGVVWVSLTWMYISEIRKQPLLGKQALQGE